MKSFLLFIFFFIINFLPGCKKDDSVAPAPASDFATDFKVEIPGLKFQIPTAAVAYERSNDTTSLLFGSSFFNICIQGCTGDPVPIHMLMLFEKRGIDLEGVYEFRKNPTPLEPEFNKTGAPPFSLQVISGKVTVDSFVVKTNGVKYLKGAMRLLTYKDNDSTVILPAIITFYIQAIGP